MSKAPYCPRPRTGGLHFSEPVTLPADGVQLFDARGEALAASAGTDVTELTVEPTGAPGGAGCRPGIATGTSAAEVLIPSGVTWEVQISLRRSKTESPVAMVRFEVP